MARVKKETPRRSEGILKVQVRTKREQWDYPIELLDIECALCHVTGVQFDKTICPYKSAILDFLQKLPFAFAQNVLGKLILPL